MSLAGLRGTSRLGARAKRNTLRETEVWLLLAETFQDHLVSSWVSDTLQDPTATVGDKPQAEQHQAEQPAAPTRQLCLQLNAGMLEYWHPKSG